MWFKIHDEVLDFHDWIFCYHEPFHNKIKIIGIIKNLWHLNNVKLILTLWKLNYVDCVLFSCILSILFTIEPTNLKKYFSWIFEKHDQTSINLTNVFDFIGYFLNRIVFDEIKWLFALTKYTTQKFTTKPQFTSMSWYLDIHLVHLILNAKNLI